MFEDKELILATIVAYHGRKMHRHRRYS